MFSNTLAPPIVAACIRSLEIIKQQPELISRILKFSRRAMRQNEVLFEFSACSPIKKQAEISKLATCRILSHIIK
jgi:7-keto-8-aminopelargonate synthetase-like enzyme